MPILKFFAKDKANNDVIDDLPTPPLAEAIAIIFLILFYIV